MAKTGHFYICRTCNIIFCDVNGQLENHDDVFKITMNTVRKLKKRIKKIGKGLMKESNGIFSPDENGSIKIALINQGTSCFKKAQKDAKENTKSDTDIEKKQTITKHWFTQIASETKI